MIVEPKRDDCQDCRDHQSGHNRQAACKGHGFVMNFSVSGVIHEVGAQAPFSPKRQRKECREKGTGKGRQIDDDKCHSSTMLPGGVDACQFQIQRVQVIHHSFDRESFADEFLPPFSKPFAQS